MPTIQRNPDQYLVPRFKYIPAQGLVRVGGLIYHLDIFMNTPPAKIAYSSYLNARSKQYMELSFYCIQKYGTKNISFYLSQFAKFNKDA